MNKNTQIRQIAVSKIQAGNNDRKVFKEETLRELAESIRLHGLAQPITVRPVGDGFEIVAGERRFRAMSQILGWDKVPALVRELSDEEASAIMLVENTSRIDLDFIAEAQAYQARIEKFGWTMEKVAEVAGVSAERVRSRIKLLKLADDVQHMVKIGQLPLGHAMAMENLDINRQRIALRVFASAKHMPMARWQEIINELYSQQVSESQMSLFSLESMLMDKVESDNVSALRGKKAITGAPINKKLPKPRTTANAEPTGAMIERYIRDLQDGGHEDAAATIGTLYNALVAGNWLSVPVGSVLAKTGDEPVGDETYTIIN
jgi:ParB/RepB/Spo0J family partition protein